MESRFCVALLLKVIEIELSLNEERWAETY